MATHVMTPARRAALRKAQLASAAKRRRGGVGSAVKRSARQRAGYARASVSVAKNRRKRRTPPNLLQSPVGRAGSRAGYKAGKAVRHVGRKGFSKKTKKVLKYTAIGVGAGTVAYVARDANKVRKQKKSTNFLDKNSRRMVSLHKQQSKMGYKYDKATKGMSGHASAGHKRNAKAHNIAGKKYSASKIVRKTGAIQKRRHIKRSGSKYLSRPRYYN